jgi:ectoine hydroxylase-related dioxygenase (phytanoyl-CoA dioxygenase family)
MGPLMMRTITQSETEQRSTYDKHGYLVFPEFLSGDELATLRAALADVLRPAEGLTGSNQWYSLVKAIDGDGHHVRRVTNPNALHTAFHEAVFNPKILDVVENLIGPNIQLHHTKINLKPPSKHAGFEWHQDYPTFPHTNFDLLAVMIMLDDSTKENGCLQVIPGSHLWGPLEHLYSRGSTYASKLEDESVVPDPGHWVSLEVPAGGMEVHHCNLVHSSRPNNGDKPRSALLIQYRASDNAQVGGIVGHYGCGMQVRGKFPYRVRMVEGTFSMSGNPNRLMSSSPPRI